MRGDWLDDARRWEDDDKEMLRRLQADEDADTSHSPMTVALGNLLRAEAEVANQERRGLLEINMVGLWRRAQDRRVADVTAAEAEAYLRDLGIDPAKLIPVLARMAAEGK